VLGLQAARENEPKIDIGGAMTFAIDWEGGLFIWGHAPVVLKA